LSIIVCTRNRADELVNCLQELKEQTGGIEGVEIIIVDNGSTDHTKEVAARFTTDPSSVFQYVWEPIPGLCVARNRGRAAAKGAVLAYIDDDAVPHPGWITGILNNFRPGRSECLAGKTVLKPKGKIPTWFPNTMYWVLGESSFGEDARFLGGDESPNGGNFAVRADVFDSVGGFDPSLTLYFDEAEFFSRVGTKGYRFFYDPEVIIDHCVPMSRLNRVALRQKAYRMGLGIGQFYKTGRPGLISRLSRLARYMTLTARVGGLWCLRPRFDREFAFWQYLGCLQEIFTP